LGGSPRLCFAPKVRALARALPGHWQGLLPAGCRHAAERLSGRAVERLGGSPRLCFAPKVRALARALPGRWQGLLPAGCRQYVPKVHGTLSKNPRDFIGIRIIGYDSGDSPRGHSGGRATAGVGRAVESSQNEESTETAATAHCRGQSPQSQTPGEMRRVVAGQKCSLRP